MSGALCVVFPVFVLWFQVLGVLFGTKTKTSQLDNGLVFMFFRDLEGMRLRAYGPYGWNSRDLIKFLIMTVYQVVRFVCGLYHIFFTVKQRQIFSRFIVLFDWWSQNTSAN